MNKYRYDCLSCKTRCDGISKGIYNFESDVEFSEYYENMLIKRIIESGYFAQKTVKNGYPDVEVFSNDKKTLLCYIEVKVQRRTFMSVQKILPQSDLVPSETLALNLSDLVRYFELSRIEKPPIYIMWVLAESPCILFSKKVMCFYQKIEKLEEIYNVYEDKRRFRRKSGIGDVVGNKHLGVVVNYHFSINELKPFILDEVLK